MSRILRRFSQLVLEAQPGQVLVADADNKASWTSPSPSGGMPQWNGSQWAVPTAQSVVAPIAAAIVTASGFNPAYNYIITGNWRFNNLLKAWGGVEVKTSEVRFDTQSFYEDSGKIQTDGDLRTVGRHIGNTGFLANLNSQYLATEGTNALSLFLTAGLSSDVSERFYMNRSGLIGWGDGTNPPDLTLSRDSASVLKTDGSMKALKGFAASVDSGVNAFTGKRTSDSDVRISIDRDGTVSWSNGAGSLEAILGTSGGQLYTTSTTSQPFRCATGFTSESNSKIASSPSQTVGFYGSTGQTRAAAIAEPTDLATALTAINALRAVLSGLGLTA